MVSLNNTCTIHFICQCFNLWCFLWLRLYAILIFISYKNPSAMLLEFLDFRVLPMNILCLFPCPCLTKTALAFKHSLSELSGKWCSHARGLVWVFGIFSSCEQIKGVLGSWQIGVPQSNLDLWWCSLLCTELVGQIGVKNVLSNGCCAKQMRQQQWLPIHTAISLFGSLCKSSVFPAAQRHFPTDLSQAMSSCQNSLFSWISVFWLERRNSDHFCSL